MISIYFQYFSFTLNHLLLFVSLELPVVFLAKYYLLLFCTVSSSCPLQSCFHVPDVDVCIHAHTCADKYRLQFEIELVFPPPHYPVTCFQPHSF